MAARVSDIEFRPAGVGRARRSGRSSGCRTRRSGGHRDGAPDEYTKACTGAPPALLAELQGHLVRGDDVVATDDALVFHTHRICSSSTAPIRTKAERRWRGGHPNSALKSGMKRSRK